MRKTLFALLGLVAIGIWAVPAHAVPAIVNPPKVSEAIPLENRPDALGEMARNRNNYQATLSGTIIKQANVTTSWFLYEGACLDRQNGLPGTLGTWVPRTSIQSDSLNTAAVGSRAGYSALDLSLATKIVHITATDPAFNNATSTTPPTVTGGGTSQMGTAASGSHAIWMGKYDANWVVTVGYPNITAQIMHIDLESNRTPPTVVGAQNYTLEMRLNFSLEQNYDYMYLMGGDGQAEDALLNTRGEFDQIVGTGGSALGTLISTVTGSFTAGNPTGNTLTFGTPSADVVGEGGSQPNDRLLKWVFPMDFRGVYFLMTADCLYSSEDGLWGFGHGCVFDDISVHDTQTGVFRSLYSTQSVAAGGLDVTGGDILVSDPVTGTNTDGIRIAARVFPGKGELWGIQAGNDYATGADICATKSVSSDHFFLGVDTGTKFALPGQYNAIVSCTFPVPAGTADITALWDEYLNLPRTAGYVQQTEYRFHKGGSWSNWTDSNAGGGVITGNVDQWFFQAGDQLAQAVQADSFQVRYILQCISSTVFAANGICNSQTEYAILYDDLFIQVTEGVPSPVIGIFPGSVAQTTFVDGTMTGENCAAPPCWPGNRGSDLQTNPNIDIARMAVKDNFNSPLGDSLTMGMVTGLRKNGMGVNWHFGYRKEINGGLTIEVTNGSFNPAHDTPRVIYRLFDPATTTWSDWDSTSLDANYISFAGDTVVIDSEYRLVWPPRDKVGGTLVNGFSLNGETQYNDLAFLPRGTRVQYYFKAVDINGGTTYAFGAGILPRETEELPTLPGSTIIAPDIQEFGVLPRKYPVGPGGTLVAGRTDSPILNLDDGYGGWSFGVDPVTQALRGMGVRADRWRFLGSGDQSHKIGGRALAGDEGEGRSSNYFPNMEQYGILDSLRSWYRVLIENTHLSTVSAFDEQDAQLVFDWAATPENSNQGDRCLFLSGDDASNAAVNTVPGISNVRRFNLSNNVFGIANVTTLAGSGAKGAWAGTATNPYPTIDDRFAAQAAGPGLAAPGSFTYQVDGGCPGPNRFDPLTATGGAFAAATYPVAASVVDAAAVAKASEFDSPADLDQVKTLAYGYSIQFVHGAPGVIPTTHPNYVRSGVQNRMQILYKFLTGCRGARGSGSLCWPCPTDASMISNWATATGFNTATYGPLMPIQDFTKATGIEVEEASAAPRANQLFGNSPNPFNPRTKIAFSAAQAGKVTIRIFNVAGQLVRTLETKVDAAGPASVYWDGKSDRNVGVPSGVFFYKATFANGTTLRADKNMVLVK